MPDGSDCSRAAATNNSSNLLAPQVWRIEQRQYLVMVVVVGGHGGFRSVYVAPEVRCGPSNRPSGSRPNCFALTIALVRCKSVSG